MEYSTIVDLLISGWTEKEYMKDRKVMHRELIYLQTVRIAISLIFMIRIDGLTEVGVCTI